MSSEKMKHVTDFAICVNETLSTQKVSISEGLFFHNDQK